MLCSPKIFMGGGMGDKRVGEMAVSCGSVVGKRGESKRVGVFFPSFFSIFIVL